MECAVGNPCWRILKLNQPWTDRPQWSWSRSQDPGCDPVLELEHGSRYIQVRFPLPLRGGGSLSPFYSTYWGAFVVVSLRATKKREGGRDCLNLRCWRQQIVLCVCVHTIVQMFAEIILSSWNSFHFSISNFTGWFWYSVFHFLSPFIFFFFFLSKSCIHNCSKLNCGNPKLARRIGRHYECAFFTLLSLLKPLFLGKRKLLCLESSC